VASDTGRLRTKPHFGPENLSGFPGPAGGESGGDIQATTTGRRLSIPQVIAPLFTRAIRRPAVRQLSPASLDRALSSLLVILDVIPDCGGQRRPMSRIL